MKKAAVAAFHRAPGYAGDDQVFIESKKSLFDFV